LEVSVYNLAGEKVKDIEISDYVFGVPFNQDVVHQALVRQRANARQGTADTKTRGEVRGSTKKLFRQKHTGMARAGSRKSPIRRGGGIAFGPHPRSYRQAMPRKMRRLAIRCALSTKVRDGEFKVVEKLSLEQPKTKEMISVLQMLGVTSSALLATAEMGENLIKSTRNLAGISLIPANILNVVDILSYKMLFMTEDAVRKAEQLWGEKPGGGGEESASV